MKFSHYSNDTDGDGDDNNDDDFDDNDGNQRSLKMMKRPLKMMVINEHGEFRVWRIILCRVDVDKEWTVIKKKIEE